MTTATATSPYNIWFVAAALLAALMILAGNVLGAGRFAAAEYLVTLAVMLTSTVGAHTLNRWALRSSSSKSLAIGMLGNGVRLAAVLAVLVFLGTYMPFEVTPMLAGAMTGGFVFLMHEVVALHRLSVRSHATP